MDFEVTRVDCIYKIIVTRTCDFSFDCVTLFLKYKVILTKTCDFSEHYFVQFKNCMLYS